MKNSTPAVLLYPQDFLTGCAEMTMAERGAYITLLCYQNAHGHMSKTYIDRVCPECPEYVLEKFEVDEDGKYYNKRMEDEIKRRVKYSESRRKNAERTSKTYDEHMLFSQDPYAQHIETETETVKETVIDNKKEAMTAEEALERLRARNKRKKAAMAAE